MGEPTTFIKIDRAILDHWISRRGEYDFFHAWLYILINANYKDGKRYYKGAVQTVRRGELVTSERKLAADWGWSRRRVHCFLDALQSDGMLSLKRTTDCTSIFVENYAKYQEVRATDVTTNEPRALPRMSHESATGVTHNKNIKESKEGKERKEYMSPDPSEPEIDPDKMPTPPEVLREMAKCIGKRMPK